MELKMRKPLLAAVAALALALPFAAPSQALTWPWQHHRAPMSGSYGGATRLFGHVIVDVFDRFGIPKARYDEGWGTITNLGAQSIAYDYSWPEGSGAGYCTLCITKYIATGTGSAAAAVTDIALTTNDLSGTATPPPAATVSSSTSAPTAGPFEQLVATTAYVGTETVNEVGIFNSPPYLATPNPSPSFSAGSATTGTLASAVLTASSASVQGVAGEVVEDTTLSCYALVLSNTTTVVTVPAWSNIGAITTCSSGGHSFPQANDHAAFLPLLFDHLVFGTGVGVAPGDSIQVNFKAVFPSGSLVFIAMFGRRRKLMDDIRTLLAA